MLYLQQRKHSSQYICGKANPTTNGYSAIINTPNKIYASIRKIIFVNSIKNMQILLVILGLLGEY